MRTNAYYRARLATMYSLIDSLNKDGVYDYSPKGSKLTDRELLKVGWISPALKTMVEDGIEASGITDESPLTFMELTTLNTWFALHPEKVCGDEYVTTSINFPLQIKAPKEYIIRKIKESLAELKNDKISGQYAKAKRVKILKLKAKALLLLKL